MRTVRRGAAGTEASVTMTFEFGDWKDSFMPEFQLLPTVNGKL